MRRLLFIAALVVGCLLATVPATGGAAGTTTHSTARMSDAELEGKIHAKLAKSKIGKDGFTVTVKAGVVTWEGKTSVVQHKGAATRMARTAGAVEVVNHIKITDETGNIKRAQVKSN